MKTGSERRSDERQQPAAAETARAPAPPGVAQLLALGHGAGSLGMSAARRTGPAGAR